MSRSTLKKNREYSRCNIAWTIPPIYWSTGNQYFTSAGSKGARSFLVSRYRIKYQDESTNVSMVSVSRRAAPPHFGHLALTNSGTPASGDWPSPVSFRSRIKYQDESTNVSMVSVSRRAAPPHFGHLALTNSGTPASGDWPSPVSFGFGGRRTGSSS